MAERGPLACDKLPDAEGILHGAQGEQPVARHPGQRGLGGSGPGGEEQLVITLLKFLPGVQIAHGDGLFLGVDGGDLMAHPHVHPEPPPEALWGLEGELLGVGDDPADVVGQAAIGVGDDSEIARHNLGPLIQPADAGGRRGPSGHPAHDDDFHRHTTFPRRAPQKNS